MEPGLRDIFSSQSLQVIVAPCLETGPDTQLVTLVHKHTNLYTPWNHSDLYLRKTRLFQGNSRKVPFRAFCVRYWAPVFLLKTEDFEDPQKEQS
jgi:hypothetical protein